MSDTHMTKRQGGHSHVLPTRREALSRLLTGVAVLGAALGLSRPAAAQTTGTRPRNPSGQRPQDGTRPRGGQGQHPPGTGGGQPGSGQGPRGGGRGGGGGGGRGGRG